MATEWSLPGDGRATKIPTGGHGRHDLRGIPGNVAPHPFTATTSEGRERVRDILQSVGAL